jgi:hypothetical protein
MLDRIAAAIASAGAPGLIGFGIDTGRLGPSAVFRFPCEGLSLSLFIQAHAGLASLILAPTLGVAILDDGAAIALVAPPALLTAALGHPAEAARAFEAYRQAEERGGRTGWLLDLLAYYHPVLLPDWAALASRG